MSTVIPSPSLVTQATSIRFTLPAEQTAQVQTALLSAVQSAGFTLPTLPGNVAISGIQAEIQGDGSCAVIVNHKVTG